MSPLFTGDTLDQYRILEPVSSGPMASVFRAIDTETGHLVAIKVPHPDAECDPLLFDRFHREAAIGRLLNHPGVVKVLPDAKDAKRSRVYMVMEWLEGRLLREILDEEGVMAPARALPLAAAICEVLDHIHNAGVVHRDLKPENIMLSPDGRVTLLDFGLAASARSRRLTFGGFSIGMGTPDYVAPEQVKGGRGDARTDIYSLGVILYEMLTGEVPFSGINALVALNSRVVNDPVPPREVNPELSPELEAVLLRALERNPANRFATAGEFANALSAPDRIQPHPAATPAPPLWRRLLFYSGLAMIPTVILGVLFLVGSRH